METTERLRRELEEMAVRDPLTGLFNRRYMEVALHEELAVTAGTGAPLSVVLIDVDHFKQLNDTLGHAEGDAALRRIAGFLDGEMRSGDVCCRMGGDELLAILPGTPKAVARRRANQWCASWDATCRSGADPLPGVTLSAGVAAAPEDGTGIDALLAVADAAMYGAKRMGGNRVGAAG